MLKGDHQVAGETHFCSEKRIPAQKQTRKPCITAKPMEGRGDESKMGTATEQQPPPTANESTAPRESAVRAEPRGGPRTAPAPSAARGMTAFRPPGEPNAAPRSPGQLPPLRRGLRSAETRGLQHLCGDLVWNSRLTDGRTLRAALRALRGSGEAAPTARTARGPSAPPGQRCGSAPPAPLRHHSPPLEASKRRCRPPPPAAVPLPIPYSPFPFPAPRAAPPPHSQTVAALRAPFPRTEAAPHSPGPRNPPTPRSPPTCRRHTPPPDTRTPPVPVGGPPAHTHTHAERSRSAQRRCGRAPGGEGRRGAEGGWGGGGWGGAALRLLPGSGGGSAPTSPPRALTPSLRSAPPPRGRARAGPRGGRREKAGGAALAPRAEGEGNGGRAPGLPPSLRPCDARGGEAGGADGYS